MKKVHKFPNVIIRIRESHNDFITDLKPFILLPSKTRSTVHVLDKQCARFIRVKMNSVTTWPKSASPSFKVERAMIIVLSYIRSLVQARSVININTSINLPQRLHKWKMRYAGGHKRHTCSVPKLGVCWATLSNNCCAEATNPFL